MWEKKMKLEPEKRMMVKNKLKVELKRTVVYLILIAAVTSAAGQRIPSQKPKLVVGITVSGMRYN